VASQPAARPVTGTPAPGNADQAGVTPTLVITPKPGASSTTPLISYLAGSTVKLEQLNGEEDKQLQKPTLSQTFTRYGIQGSDLGYSFEHQGLEYFLFGDTVGKLDKALDTIAITDAVDPEKGVRLD
jgi:hypothetical protein